MKNINKLFDTLTQIACETNVKALKVQAEIKSILETQYKDWSVQAAILACFE